MMMEMGSGVGVIGESGTLFLKWGAPQGSLNASLKGGSCSKTNALMTRGCVLEQVAAAAVRRWG